MRTQLAPLLERQRWWLGRLRASGGRAQVRICVNNAKVYKWSRFKTTKQMCKHGPAATADHMWIYAETSEDIEDKKDVMYQKSPAGIHLGVSEGGWDEGLRSFVDSRSSGCGQDYSISLFSQEYEKVIEKVIELGATCLLLIIVPLLPITGRC